MKKNIKWMILGKTGNGKSSLLNYLFNAKLKTGAGKPITPYGIFDKIKFPAPIKKDVTYKFYDSWGLESNKSDEWKELIFSKLDAPFNVKCDKLFVGVIYCLSFNNRYEPFEKDLIKDLITKFKYNVIIALTNADISDYKIKNKKYKEYLIADLGIDNKDHYCILDVCSISGEKWKGEKIIQFGKEKVLQKIEEYGDSNLISIVKSKLGKWKDKWIEDCRKYARDKMSKIKDSYVKSTLLEIDEDVISALTEKYYNAIGEIEGQIEYTAKWKDYIKTAAYKGKNLKSFDWYDILNPIKTIKYIFFETDKNQQIYTEVFKINRIKVFEDKIKEVYNDVLSNIKKQESEIKLLGYKDE